jgi:Concanavalin A-like lectin/glucanases superfamily
MGARPATLLLACALGCDPRVVTVQAVEPPSDTGPVSDTGLGAPAEPADGGPDETPADAAPEAGPCEAPIDTPTPSAGAAALFLRYDFAGRGSSVRDRVGDAHGVILGGGSLDCSGSLTLDGLDDFVDMPNGLVSPHESITAMAWITWPAGTVWERVFAFGNTDRGEGNVGSAVTSLSLTTRSFTGEKLFGMYELNGLHGVERRALQVNDAPIQVALVFDGAGRALRVYQQGELDDSSDVDLSLSQLVDVDNWLGRSHWAADAFFRGQLHEFRLYDRALSDGEIAEAFRRGMEAP